MPAHDEASVHALAVVDATLAGDPVAAADAELAELTLLLADQRPRPRPEFVSALDERLARGFAAPPDGTPASALGRARPWWRGRRWLFAPGAGLVAAGLAAAAIVAGGGSSTPQLAHRPSLTSAGAALPSSSSASTPTPTPSAAGQSGAAASGAAGPVAPPATAQAGRQVIQGASLDLSTGPSQVDDVARQVFTVVAAQNGVVESSNVTATNGPGGGAQFSLTVPSANLGAAMAALSRLRGASVLSRNDISQDVTGRAGGAGQRLADARALRSALLRKLALATTSTAVDSLRLQIRDANASIASDLATLRQLERQVANSHIELTITGVAPAGPPRPAHSGGLTLGRAVHDAGRVLVIAAGVALIAAAVLVPLALLAGAGMWVAAAVRRHRREQALDLV